MKAIGYSTAGPIDSEGSFVAFEADLPTLKPRDILVQVKGISMNPVDTKVRTRASAEQGTHKVIGYDAAGSVIAMGSDVEHFQLGDQVFYAGDITRPGSNAQFQAADERIVGKKPDSLDFAEAAALPLTSITAWEMLFDSFGLREGEGSGEELLVLGAAGGVGSILIQLAKQLTGLTVIATASRPETVEWVKKMGADHVVDHHKSLTEQIETLGLKPRYVASLNATQDNFEAILELVKPRGHIALIDDPENLDIKAGKPKALSFSWEFMFTRSMFDTEDMDLQHKLLTKVSEMVDKGQIISTMTQNWGPLDVELLKKLHRLQEGGKVFGKNVAEGLGA